MPTIQSVINAHLTFKSTPQSAEYEPVGVATIESCTGPVTVPRGMDVKFFNCTLSQGSEPGYVAANNITFEGDNTIYIENGAINGEMTIGPGCIVNIIGTNIVSKVLASDSKIEKVECTESKFAECGPIWTMSNCSMRSSYCKIKGVCSYLKLSNSDTEDLCCEIVVAKAALDADNSRSVFIGKESYHGTIETATTSFNLTDSSVEATYYDCTSAIKILDSDKSRSEFTDCTLTAPICLDLKSSYVNGSRTSTAGGNNVDKNSYYYSQDAAEIKGSSPVFTSEGGNVTISSCDALIGDIDASDSSNLSITDIGAFSGAINATGSTVTTHGRGDNQTGYTTVSQGKITVINSQATCGGFASIQEIYAENAAVTVTHAGVVEKLTGSDSYFTLEHCDALPDIEAVRSVIEIVDSTLLSVKGENLKIIFKNCQIGYLELTSCEVEMYTSIVSGDTKLITCEYILDSSGYEKVEINTGSRGSWHGSTFANVDMDSSKLYDLDSEVAGILSVVGCLIELNYTQINGEFHSLNSTLQCFNIFTPGMVGESSIVELFNSTVTDAIFTTCGCTINTTSFNTVVFEVTSHVLLMSSHIYALCRFDSSKGELAKTVIEVLFESISSTVYLTDSDLHLADSILTSSEVIYTRTVWKTVTGVGSEVKFFSSDGGRMDYESSGVKLENCEWGNMSLAEGTKMNINIGKCVDISMLDSYLEAYTFEFRLALIIRSVFIVHKGTCEADIAAQDSSSVNLDEVSIAGVLDVNGSTIELNNMEIIPSYTIATSFVKGGFIHGQDIYVNSKSVWDGLKLTAKNLYVDDACINFNVIEVEELISVYNSGVLSGNHIICTDLDSQLDGLISVDRLDVSARTDLSDSCVSSAYANFCDYVSCVGSHFSGVYANFSKGVDIYGSNTSFNKVFVAEGDFQALDYSNVTINSADLYGAATFSNMSVGIVGQADILGAFVVDNGFVCSNYITSWAATELSSGGIVSAVSLVSVDYLTVGTQAILTGAYTQTGSSCSLSNTAVVDVAKLQSIGTATVDAYSVLRATYSVITQALFVLDHSSCDISNLAVGSPDAPYNSLDVSASFVSLGKALVTGPSRMIADSVFFSGDTQFVGNVELEESVAKIVKATTLDTTISKNSSVSCTSLYVDGELSLSEITHLSGSKLTVLGSLDGDLANIWFNQVFIAGDFTLHDSQFNCATIEVMQDLSFDNVMGVINNLKLNKDTEFIGCNMVVQWLHPVGANVSVSMDLHITSGSLIVQGSYYDLNAGDHGFDHIHLYNNHSLWQECMTTDADWTLEASSVTWMMGGAGHDCTVDNCVMGVLGWGFDGTISITGSTTGNLQLPLPVLFG